MTLTNGGHTAVEPKWTMRVSDLPVFLDKETSERMFDEIPILEVREACLRYLTPRSDEDFNWYAERIRAYMDMPPDPMEPEALDPVREDMLIIPSLLRHLANVRPEHRTRAFDLMLDAFERIVHPIGPKEVDADKDIYVIVCGHLIHHPEDYNDRARQLIKEALEKELRLWPRLPTSEEGCNRIERLFFVIQRVGDMELLPLVERVALPLGVSSGQFNIAEELRGAAHDGNRERIILVALAHTTIRHLETLSGLST